PSSAADEPGANSTPEPVSRRLVRSLAHPDSQSPVVFLRYCSDGRLAAAGYPSGILQIWDPKSGKELSRVTLAPGERGTVTFGALTADWKTAFTPFEGRKKNVQIDAVVQKRGVVEYEGAVRVWDVTTGKPRSPIKLAPGRG